MPFPQKKEYAQAFLASAYSHDYLTVVEYEQRVEQLESADTYEAVETLLTDLPPSLAPALPPVPGHGELPVSAPGPHGVAPRWTASPPGTVGHDQVLRGRGQNVRKRGVWLTSDRLVLEQTGSTISLRFDQLSGLRNVRLDVELDIKSCTCRLLVPEGTRVSEQVETNGSTFSIARKVFKTEQPDGPLVVLSGVANGSTIRVARLRP
jgi:hypothetical protein